MPYHIRPITSPSCTADRDNGLPYPKGCLSVCDAGVLWLDIWTGGAGLCSKGYHSYSVSDGCPDLPKEKEASAGNVRLSACHGPLSKQLHQSVHSNVSSLRAHVRHAVATGQPLTALLTYSLDCHLVDGKQYFTTWTAVNK